MASGDPPLPLGLWLSVLRQLSGCPVLSLPTLTQLSADLGFPLPANSAYDVVLLNELPWRK